MEIGTIDISIIILYFGFIILIGYFSRRKVHNITDYFLAGRRLTLPIFVATLVSTWYGGILGVGELSFSYGFVNWLTQGFFWYMSYLVFALFLANRIRKSKLYTVPDQLERFYDKKSRLLGAFFNYIMVTPAPYVFSLGIIFSLLFGVDMWVGIVIGTVVSIFYTMRGGFLGVIYTDIIQFVLMVTGAALVIPFAVSKYGGIDFLRANLPATHFTLTGEWTTQMILVWGFIACWTLIDPTFYQRCYAAKNSRIPRKGILISILFWAMFDVCTTFTGMYAAAAMPNIDPVTSYPVFAMSVLPVFIKGLFLAGIIATVMSTIDSFTFAGAMNIAHDLYKRILNPEASEKKVMRVAKLGVVLTGGFAMVIALASGSIVSMWYTIGTIGISALLVPMLAGFFANSRKANAAFASMLAGSAVSVVWLVHGWVNMYEGWPMYIWGIEPLYPGLAASLVVFTIWSVAE